MSDGVALRLAVSLTRVRCCDIGAALVVLNSVLLWLKALRALLPALLDSEVLIILPSFFHPSFTSFSSSIANPTSLLRYPACKTCIQSCSKMQEIQKVKGKEKKQNLPQGLYLSSFVLPSPQMKLNPDRPSISASTWSSLEVLWRTSCTSPHGNKRE